MKAGSTILTGLIILLLIGTASANWIDDIIGAITGCYPTSSGGKMCEPNPLLATGIVDYGNGDGQVGVEFQLNVQSSLMQREGYFRVEIVSGEDVPSPPFTGLAPVDSYTESFTILPNHAVVGIGKVYQFPKNMQPGSYTIYGQLFVGGQAVSNVDSFTFFIGEPTVTTTTLKTTETTLKDTTSTTLKDATTSTTLPLGVTTTTVKESCGGVNQSCCSGYDEVLGKRVNTLCQEGLECNDKGVCVKSGGGGMCEGYYYFSKCFSYTEAYFTLIAGMIIVFLISLRYKKVI